MREQEPKINKYPKEADLNPPNIIKRLARTGRGALRFVVRLIDYAIYLDPDDPDKIERLRTFYIDPNDLDKLKHRDRPVHGPGLWGNG